MLFVQKYGGSSLCDIQRIFAAAARVSRLARLGHRAVVVVSAQGDTTDDLIRNAMGVNVRASQRELDAYLSCGEQLSAGLLTMALGTLGYSAVSLTGAQAGIHTDSVHGDARITHVDTGRLKRELEMGKIVVVAGFQGVNPEGDITTLGRGGSDTTAVALAAWLGADRCQIFTDVDGVYDRDPRRFPGAQRFERLDYDQMLQLCREGAQVLHQRCVELAKEKGVELEVLSSFTGAPGTMVTA